MNHCGNWHFLFENEDVNLLMISFLYLNTRKVCFCCCFVLIFFLIYRENKAWHVIQIVSIGDNLNKMLCLIFCEKKRKCQRLMKENVKQEKFHSFVINSFLLQHAAGKEMTHSLVFIYKMWPKEESSITKTCLFKYTENFTTKKWKFSDKKFLYFTYFWSKHWLWVLVRTASMRWF